MFWHVLAILFWGILFLSCKLHGMIGNDMSEEVDIPLETQI